MEEIDAGGGEDAKVGDGKMLTCVCGGVLYSVWRSKNQIKAAAASSCADGGDVRAMRVIAVRRAQVRLRYEIRRARHEEAEDDDDEEVVVVRRATEQGGGRDEGEARVYHTERET
jgi:hypothetical protein